MSEKNNNGSNSENSNKSRTKMLIVPAKYILGCVEDDPETAYPVAISVRSGNFGSAYYANNPNEILGHIKSMDVFQCSLVSISRSSRGTHVDLSRNGRFIVDDGLLKERRHMDTLLQGQVEKMYNLLFHPEKEENQEVGA